MKYRNVYFSALCTRKSHTRCLSMRNAILRSSKNVLMAYVSNPNKTKIYSSNPKLKAELEAEKYCVGGRAIVFEHDLKKFYRDFKKIKTNSQKPFSIKKYKFLVGY